MNKQQKETIKHQIMSFKIGIKWTKGDIKNRKKRIKEAEDVLKSLLRRQQEDIDRNTIRKNLIKELKK